MFIEEWRISPQVDKILKTHHITVVSDAVEFEKQNLKISSLDQKQIISCFLAICNVR